MPTAPLFERTFGRIYQKPCWGVRVGYGSSLIMEFGRPHLVIREPIVAKKGVSARVRDILAQRNVNAAGEWHLWIYCCDWEVLSKGKGIADSSTKVKMRPAANFLNGQKLMGFSISSRSLLCTFEFDLGGVLRTRPYDSGSEQWLLFEPSHRVLSVRADGHYRHARADAPEVPRDWKPLAAKSSPTP